MTYDEKLDLILSKLTALEAVFASNVQIPPVANGPTGGLFDFVRPDGSEKPHGLGTPMTWPDVGEAISRACYGINWRGDQVVAGAAADDVWAEIDALKAGNEKLIDLYRKVDPTMAGYALLTGRIDPSKYDARTFGINASKRNALAGETVERFLEDQFRITGGPGIGGQ